MNKKNELKEEIHLMNGLFGRIAFSMDELHEQFESEEGVSRELLDEIQTTIHELKDVWLKIRQNI